MQNETFTTLPEKFHLYIQTTFYGVVELIRLGDDLAEEKECALLQAYLLFDPEMLERAPYCFVWAIQPPDIYVRDKFWADMTTRCCSVKMMFRRTRKARKLLERNGDLHIEELRTRLQHEGCIDNLNPYRYIDLPEY